MKTRKSWKEKLHDDNGLPKVEPIAGKLIEMWGEGTVVIAKPLDVDTIMRKVPKGKLTTVNEIRKIIAAKYETTIACPLTTGIFVRISAEAAEEEFSEGKRRITPYWRTLKEGGILNEKYPGGIEAQMAKLENEGFSVVPKGKKNFRVLDFDKYIAKIEL
ncbi:MAG: MGMT family protein [Melioribacteraceae bacterium]|nr:MGMT family protein [Melioribacteraceae bacterium]MCF8412157.1 MGMT family protein [Melioribacteraceae bacterium]MCF8431837.1 MGMT family protein [Melioribacteraceae bacterium]